MGSKAFLLLGLLVAIILLISSEVAARDLAETSAEKQDAEAVAETNGVGDAKYGGYGGRGGGGYGGRGGYGGYPGRGGYGGYPGRGGGGYGGGGHCRYGCCGGSGYGRGCRCCSYAGEAANTKTEARPQN